MLFDSFPPVLQLQLRRFEYDFQRDTMIKVRISARGGCYPCVGQQTMPGQDCHLCACLFSMSLCDVVHV